MSEFIPPGGREPTPSERAGMAWWNAMTEPQRRAWLERADTAQPAEAWAVYQLTTKALDLAGLAWSGDGDAAARLRLLGESLAFAGGAGAMTRLQGIVHDHALETRHAAGRDLAGLMGSHWEHIPAWAAL